MADAEVAARLACSAEAPHHFAISERKRARGGIVLTLDRLDARYPPRDIFVTTREMKMSTDDVWKPCFVCVDKGVKEKAIAIPKEEIDAGLPPE
jgi:hypothetical protein